MAFLDLFGLKNYFYTKEEIDTKLSSIESGAQGPQGVKGDTGAQGAQGPQGVKGDTGTFDATTQFDALTTDAKTIIAAINELQAKIPSIWIGTQAEYDALATKDENTLYFIKS
ncbi:collagen-like triple helix repeat-containing protein [Niameybacter massiliensis]|uniref:collagen-like triple helix repeat-containing protein n=1 Tax=Niameybacter massiliensis TaxID=1658108 RepID=UPI0006B63993|nr:collagen-like protein [Niameybacter massiliensis]